MIGKAMLRRALLGGVLGSALAGCGGEPANPTNQGPIAVTGVAVSATPNPAAVTVTVQASATVRPSGANQAVTWSSSDPTIASVAASGLITLKLRGTVVITATSTADPTHSGSVTLTVVCPAPRVVSQNVEGDTTWENWVPDPTCFDYVVQTSVEVNDETLTIEPGTRVGFDTGLGLRVRGGGVIGAAGTANEPIVLTGTTAQRGFWKGLALEFTSHGNNVLTWVTVEYTGGHGISNTQDASLIMAGDAVARIENSTFRESAGYGISLDFQSGVTGSGGNTFTGNALGAAWTWGSAVPNLLGAVLAPNDRDVVVVFPDAITGTARWPAATYHVLRNNGQAFTVQPAGELTLEPGTELRFEGDQSVLVQGGLHAVGTAAAPIVFRGTEPVRGHWGGLGFIGSDHGMNRLEYVTIEHGGGRTIGGALERANLVITNGGAGEHSVVAVGNSTLRQSAEYGLWVAVNSGIPDFTGNVLTGNALGPAYVQAPVADQLLDSNDFSGNDVDEVAVETGVGMALTQAARWKDLGVPYYLRYHVGSVWEVMAPLTIAPGADLLLAPDLGISMRNGGTMSAVGTPTDAITMRARTTAWQGLEFVDATGTFDYAVLGDGGSLTWGGVLAPGLITIRSDFGPSNVTLGDETTLAGGGFMLVFSLGPSTAVGCRGNVFVPPPETVSDHCR